MKSTNSDKEVNTNMTIHAIASRPKDYYCDCVYCSKFYKGELIQPDGKYYSARNRTGYSKFEKTVKHLCAGHFQGYAFCVERFSKEGDIVFDPCAGSGTALVEAMKRGRKGMGIELEFHRILQENCMVYGDSQWEIYKGDAREVSKNLLARDKVTMVDMIVTGTPYNNNADAPERKKIKGKDSTFNYDESLTNLAHLKDKEYYKELETLYHQCAALLKDGGKFIIIIKDPIRNKKAYPLHENIGNILKNIGLKPKEVWIHKHWPPTMFISTYKKRFPKVEMPLYQTILVFQK